jgi:hypothetical protein
MGPIKLGKWQPNCKGTTYSLYWECWRGEIVADGDEVRSSVQSQISMTATLSTKNLLLELSNYSTESNMTTKKGRCWFSPHIKQVKRWGGGQEMDGQQDTIFSPGWHEERTTPPPSHCSVGGALMVKLDYKIWKQTEGSSVLIYCHAGMWFHDGSHFVVISNKTHLFIIPWKKS